MDYIALMISLHLVGRTLSACMLDQNNNNKFPFVLRLLVHVGDVRCHAALVSPKYIIGPYEPVRDVIDNNSFFFLYVIINGMNPLNCYEIERVERAVRAGRQNIIFGILSKELLVTKDHSRYPFLYPPTNDYSVEQFVGELEKLPDFECCNLPAFGGRAHLTSKLSVSSVTYIKRETSDWWKLFCRLRPDCVEFKDDVIIALDPVDRSNDFAFYQGAMIVCNGNPMGMMSTLIQDPVSNVNITVFESIATIAEGLHGFLNSLITTTERTMETQMTGEVNKWTGEQLQASVRLVMKQRRKGDQSDENDAVKGCPEPVANILIGISATMNAFRLI